METISAIADNQVSVRHVEHGDSTGRPGLREFLQRVLGAARHGAERMADQVGGFLEDGKLFSPLEKVVHIYDGKLGVPDCSFPQRGALPIPESASDRRRASAARGTFFSAFPIPALLVASYFRETGRTTRSMSF
jgi:hypothetical protein